MQRTVRLMAIAALMASLLPLSGRTQDTIPPLDVRLVLPPVCYAVVGVPLSIYFDNIVLAERSEDYGFKVECGLGRTDNRRWTATPSASDVGDHPLSISVNDINGNVLARANSILHVAPANAGANRSIRLLLVGDSQTHVTIYPNHIASLLSLPGNPTWTMLGKHVPPNAAPGVAHEGYGGWTWEQFVQGPQSPFVFPVDGGKVVLDLPRYFQTVCAGGPPDFVTFHLGINDCFYVDPRDSAAIDAQIDTVFAHADRLLAAFHHAAAKADLGICLTIPPNSRESGFLASYQGKFHRWGWKCIQHRLVERELEHFRGRESERIVIVPTELNLDPVDGYPEDNGVHPNTVGYQQTGNAIFAWLKSRLESQASTESSEP